MEVNVSSLNYVTIIYGLTRLLVSFYAFFLVGLRYKKIVFQPFVRFQKNFLFIFGLWEFTRAIFLLYSGTELLPLLSSIVYIPVSLTGLTYFYFCFTYTFPHKVHLMKYMIWLIIIPCVTIILALVPYYDRYFIIFTDQLTYIPYRENLIIYRPWFYVHSIFNYTLAFLGIVFLFIKFKYPSTQNRRFCFYAIVASLLFIFQNVYRTFIQEDGAIWLSPILSIAIITLFFWIVYADEAEITVSLGQEELTKSLLFPIFFLDNKNKIIFANKEALAVCPNIHLNPDHPSYEEDIFKNFSPYDIDLTHVDNNLYFQQGDLLLQRKSDGSLYYLQNQPLATQNKNEPGKLITLTTISSLKKFFETLEEKAFLDPLCGCYNRHFMELKQIELDSGKINLSTMTPLTFIMCDIDGLKTVNDTYGHEEGDNYILLCHQVIKSSIRQNDLIFRMGGDEFLVLLPKTDKATAQAIEKQIEFLMQDVEKPYVTNISTGSSTTEQLSLNFHQCIEEADHQMYIKKSTHKAALAKSNQGSTR